MSSTTLFNQPQQTVGAVADFFGLAHDEARAAALAQLGSLSYYSKDINRAKPYDSAARVAELGETERRLGGEVEAAIAWANLVSAGWLSRSPFPVE